MDDAELNKQLYQAYHLGQRVMLLKSSQTGPVKTAILHECMQIMLDIAAGKATAREGGADIFTQVTPAFRSEGLKKEIAKWTSEDIKHDRELAKRIVAGSGLPAKDIPGEAQI